MTATLSEARVLLRKEASRLLADADRLDGRGYRVLASDLRALARRLAATAEQLTKWERS